FVKLVKADALATGGTVQFNRERDQSEREVPFPNCGSHCLYLAAFHYTSNIIPSFCIGRMSLKKYAEKRHFEKTPEPAPGKTPARGPAQKNELQFCVQRHHASHLHYDFRLEVGETLKSWAVPKGPTLDPEQKRLAMMVEDHPVEYGGFEGVIPKGNYGAGSVMLWDRGTYQLLGDATAQEQLARGDFKFHVDGEKIKGDFAIVHIKRGKGNEWLLIKKKDAFAHVGWDPEDHSRSVLTGRTQEE